MKIGNPADKSVLAPVVPSPQGPAAAGTPATAGTATGPAETVALSSTAADLIAGAVTPEFDADKVARISRAIAEGTFTIDAEAIADKLIANAQELLSKPTR